MPTYCCLFNHYNANNAINDYVFKLLEQFYQLDCEIIFISNSPIDSEQQKENLTKHVKTKYIERENTGYDFGAWQHAINSDLIPPDTQYLFLVNDSVFGPLHDINPIIQKMNADPSVDFWGLTDCNQLGWHLQSYFLCFKQKVFKSNAFKKFFKQDFISQQKTEIIRNGEILLTKTLTNAGFKGKAFLEYQTFIDGKDDPFRFKNPMHFYGDTLVKEFQFPFIKKEFVFKNPERIDITEGVLGMLVKETDYPISFIQQVLIDACNVQMNEKDKEISIDVICHLYYLNTAFNFLIDISPLKKYNSKFFFNISTSLYTDPYFMDLLLNCFPNSIILHSTNLGKDIGGKLSAIAVSLQLESKSEYTILLHDKQSPHTSMGDTWKKKLFRIIQANKIPQIVNSFRTNNKVGIIASNEFIMNEFNDQKEEFDCTCNQILKSLLTTYQMKSKSYDFVGGTMFWIRTKIVNQFFTAHDPLQIRATLEKGNVLDDQQGTNTHAWERMLSWIAIDQGYKIEGIDE